MHSDRVSVSDSAKLVAITKGCPFTDGEVVYQARALYNSIFMTNIMFEDNCKDVEERMLNIKQVETPPFAVNLYPNPTPGEFTIELGDNENSRWEIKITDIQGRKVYEAVSDAKKVSLKPETENGVYLVRITNLSTNETVPLMVSSQLICRKEIVCGK